MQWDNDRLKIQHAKSKMDPEGTRAFPMAVMANRYDWTICLITALAVFMSCYDFPPGTDQLFQGEKISNITKLFSDRMIIRRVVKKVMPASSRFRMSYNGFSIAEKNPPSENFNF